MSLSMVVCAWAAMLACVACSQSPQQAAAPVPSASSAAPGDASAPAASAGGAATVPAMPGVKPAYLFDLLQQPDFAKALDALHGAQSLPAWVRQGGTATPVRNIRVGGRSMSLATACKPHDCPTERVALLYDAQSHAMWGLFAQRAENLPPAVDPRDSSQDKLTWLGEPDAAQRGLLRNALYAR